MFLPHIIYYVQSAVAIVGETTLLHRRTLVWWGVRPSFFWQPSPPGANGDITASPLSSNAFRLCVFGGYQELTLQSCLISKMEGLEGLTSLTRLTLYDNQILSLNVPPNLSGLTHLDISYNLIRGTSALAECPLLEEVRALEAKGAPL